MKNYTRHLKNYMTSSRAQMISINKTNFKQNKKEKQYE